MKKQVLAFIQNQSNKRETFSVSIVLALVSSSITLSANAQSYSQNNLLPPEVWPMSQTINYGSDTNSSNVIAGSNLVPGIATPTTNMPVMQSPQEARQALYNSLMGSNNYPQFNSQAVNQPNVMNMNANQLFNANQTMPQTLNNQMNSNMQTSQNNLTMNPSPPQSQTLTGAGNPQAATQPRTSGGISHLLGVVTSLGMTGAVLGTGGGSAGGLYSGGMLGAGLLNYGANSGFRF